MSICILFSVIIYMLSVCCAKNPVLQTRYGAIKGFNTLSIRKTEIEAFLGIPYAKAPIGDLRFKPPKPVEEWSGVYDCTKDGPACPQYDYVFYKRVVGQEDCLKLNVYRPKVRTSNHKLPVMVFIYGGGFNIGFASSAIYVPGFLVTHDVILVTFNYRVGPFGFLSTEDEYAPGNAGLHDQIEALKWVKQNIDVFGGDPDSVTLFGESAGAASVHFLMISPLSQGLFHRAICQSGTAFSPWAKHALPIKESAEKLGRMFNCSTRNSQVLVECLRDVNAQEMAGATTALWEWGKLPFPFGPRVDKEAENPVLPENPEDMIKNGKFAKIPLLLGINKDEGIGTTIELLKNDSQMRVMREDFDYVCALNLNIQGSGEDITSICKRVREYYLDGKPLDASQKDAITELYSDVWFISNAIQSANWHSLYAPTYFYMLVYSGRFSVATIFTGERINGVSHGDELLYLFGPNQVTPIRQGDPEYKMVDKMTTKWVHFATYGDPTPGGKPFKWPRYTFEEKQYVKLDLKSSVDSNLKPEVLAFFQSIYKWPVPYPAREEL